MRIQLTKTAFMLRRTGIPVACNSNVWVLLLKKLAEHIDGVDLTSYAPGQRVFVSEQEARLLIAEEWAEPVDPPVQPASPAPSGRTVAA